MRRDILLGSLGVIAASFFMFSNYYKASETYRKFDISPSVYKHDIAPIDTKKVFQGKINKEITSDMMVYEPKYKVSVDLTAGDRAALDTYMELPLETDGKTRANDALYKDIEETDTENPTFIKYIKFQCTSIRNPEESRVCLGGFKFFQGQALASTTPVVLWNPHSGTRENYVGGSWSDSDQRSVIFRFSQPILVDRYELISSLESPDFDPVNWKLEGSMNGTYWLAIDDRTHTDTAFPKQRGLSTIYLMNKI